MARVDAVSIGLNAKLPSFSTSALSRPLRLHEFANPTPAKKGASRQPFTKKVLIARALTDPNCTMADPKLVWNPDNVRDVAESVGISSLNEDAVRSLSQEVEYRVGQVIVEAMRFMHNSGRTVLGTQDISQALKVLDVEPLYGYESTRPLRFGEASLGPGQPLFYIEDEEVDFEKLINAPLPKVPRDISFTG